MPDFITHVGLTHYVVLAVTSLEEAKMFINAEPWKSNR